MNVNPKVTAGAVGGAGIGGPLAIVFLYVLEELGLNPPDAVDQAITAIIVAAVGFAAGWLRPSA